MVGRLPEQKRTAEDKQRLCQPGSINRTKAATPRELVKARGLPALFETISGQIGPSPSEQGTKSPSNGERILDSEPEREPLFRAPWPVLALIGVILVAWLMQLQIGADAVAAGLGFSPAGPGQRGG